MEFGNILGSIFFVFLFIARYFQVVDGGSILSLLLASQAGIAAFLLVFHKRAKRTSRIALHLASWLCVFLPFMLVSENGNPWFSVPGLLIALWSLASLGRSFSVAPDDRGLINRGPYRIIRHPMYAGEILSYLGLCLAVPLIRNWFVFAVIVVLLIVRINAEERAIDGYDGYKRVVRFRLIPFFW